MYISQKAAQTLILRNNFIVSECVNENIMVDVFLTVK